MVKAHAIPLGARAARPVRDAALWLALLVALASSLLSNGLPRTTALGSAFNPATTSVVLKPIRPAPRATVDTVRRDDGPAAGASDIAIAARTVAPTASTSPIRLIATAHVPAASLHPHPVLDGSPRGPPLA